MIDFIQENDYEIRNSGATQFPILNFSKTKTFRFKSITQIQTHEKRRLF